MKNNRTRFLGLLLGLMMALPVLAMTGPAFAATPAETFVTGNIQTGLAILANTKLTPAQHKAQFQTFLLGITDMKRIAVFTLGKYAASASAADQDAFATAFQNYAVAVYRSYFERYSGQTMVVLRSSQRAPGDFIVVTNMVDKSGGQPPLEIDFRVRTDGAKTVITDFSVAGIWLALAEQADFGAVLAKNGGSIPGLIQHLNATASQY
jgi:phospholipid transport system substrate-binding protein